MIKETAYIRKFSETQKAELQRISDQTGIKSVTKILFYVLGKFSVLQQDKARLQRIIEMKQKKIEQKQNEIDFYKSHAKAIQELSAKLNM